MTMIESSPVDRDLLAPAACLFGSFSDPARLAILQLLLQRESRVVDLTRELGLAQSTVSQHVACLRDCRLVESRTAGRSVFYRLTCPDEVAALLTTAEGLLARTGSSVALCPTYGTPR